MSDAKNHSGDDQPLSEETREDLRRMTLSLTNQRTIETLTRTAMMAKFKRQSTRALSEDGMDHCKAEKQAPTEKKATTAKIIDGHVSHRNVKDGDTEPDKDNNKKQA
ncbi:hypothetical protein FVEN_g12329 [Fusarium venenatum]|uniref:Uncharacterized protein n=1 Tax=Fusarium venenatum TaxID=56646 RepID=A0A2L2TL67_9HYPO|nr:uncharacterized protein FVRRES_05546 [Fusarium venenatum]KAG8349455.1 hypothetical protein FVEN_g12329 [Fusarium venenatum]KAH6992623.1 hypothetical protein EDB82DRAFT_497157 [Fusarium venenatum]CEI61110.1 unnamed protein product [Fusarium venenatum]